MEPTSIEGVGSAHQRDEGLLRRRIGPALRGRPAVRDAVVAGPLPLAACLCFASGQITGNDTPLELAVTVEKHGRGAGMADYPPAHPAVVLDSLLADRKRWELGLTNRANEAIFLVLPSNSI